MNEKVNKEIKKIDYIRAVSDLSELSMENRIYIAGMARGMLMQKNLSDKKEN
ncbi:hypothetical protein [Clostridium sardiniense]|uniref:hypothetical protein n=1 Tax=Clostridium sardiniense TaxID=29369 RepID=UPI00195E499C|nr:hypothetical protein [Clostridium sardiniense]MBM7836461.1 putative peptidase [Clostridium sardiniense]